MRDWHILRPFARLREIRADLGARSPSPRRVARRPRPGFGTHSVPLADHAARVHLHLVQARPPLPARSDGARGHLDLVLPGRQDRRHRAQRRGQVQPPADHGRARRRVHRRGPPDARLHGGLPQPGAAAGPGQGRQGQRDGRRRRGRRPHRAVQRRHGALVGPGRRLRGDRRRAGGARGPDLGRRRVEPGTQRGHRHGRPALSAGRRRGDPALGRREAARRAVQAAAPAPGPAPARRADQPSRRRIGRVAGAVPRRVQRDRRRDHPRPLLPRQRREVDPGAGPRPRDPVLGQLLELAGAEARAHDAREQGVRHPRPDPGARARVGPPVARGHGRRRARRGSAPTSSCSPRRRTTRAAPGSWRSPSPRVRGWATPSSRSRTCARATATGC